MRTEARLYWWVCKGVQLAAVKYLHSSVAMFGRGGRVMSFLVYAEVLPARSRVDVDERDEWPARLTAARDIAPLTAIKDTVAGWQLSRPGEARTAYSPLRLTSPRHSTT